MTITTAKQLLHAIKNPPKDGSPRKVVWTPELALEGLTVNSDEVGMQRPQRSGWIRELARRMRDGLWADLTSEGLAFDTDGRVQDGQHRLHAVVGSGVTITAWVYFGQPPENFKKVNLNKPRSPADIFSIHGVTDATAAAAITRQVNVYDNGGYRGNSTGFTSLRSPEESYGFYLKIGREVVHDGCKLAGRLKHNKLPNPCTIAGLYVVARRIAPEEAERFFNAIVTGENLKPRSMERKLRDHLLINGKELRPKKVAADTIRAWNAKRARRRSVDFSPVDRVPELV